MFLQCTGLNYRTAPLDIREEVSFSKQELVPALLGLRNYISDGVILSTCNRTEIYAEAKDPGEGNRAICRFLAEFHGIDVERFAPHLYLLTDLEAVRHLFRVAAGLDSMIVGESQILGQVRGALTATAGARSPEPVLSRLFHHALRTGRRVREETNIGKNALSVSYAGVRLAQRMLGDLAGRSVLLVGAGEAGHLVAKAIRTVGVGELLIANRTLSRAEALARELDGQPVPFDGLWERLQDVDIVISSTDAPEPIFSRSAVAAAMDGRGARSLFFFDLSMPRDVDPEVGCVPGAYLFNIDDLSAIAEENRLEREKAASSAGTIVEEEVERFSQWWRSLAAVPLIADLLGEAEAIRRQELENALRKLPGLDAGERKVIERLSRSMMKKLLHRPLMALKQPQVASNLQASHDLYPPAQQSDKDPGRN